MPIPIDTSLLIAAPVLQDYLVDKDTGFPLAAGIVTFYQDNQRNILKNWYYQSNNSPPYQYSAGPNPMILTGVGTFSDANGNDVIPYFYPWNESIPGQPQLYYVVVQNSNMELQFTREGFPPLPPGISPGTMTATLDNYLINNEFWRNFGSGTITTPNTSTTINNSTYLMQTLAPSAHDGFSMQDIVILKDIAGATDILTFTPFPTDEGLILTDDITPEFYLNWNCTAVQSGQMLKCIQFPLQLHIQALAGEDVSIAFHAINNGTAGSITVNILQYCGDGSANSSFKTIQTFPLNDSWTKYTLSFALPSADGISVSSTGNDALYVQFVFPPTSIFNISFAKPQLYLGNAVATNQYDTYDQIDAVINSPRTGDIRTSLNSFAPFGWVLMNDGTIGNASSGSTTRANIDAWPLFNLIWNEVGSTYAPIFTSSGSSSSYGSSAFADWSANKRLSLTKQLGRLIASAGTPSSGTNTGTNWALGQTTGNELYTLVANNLPAHTHPVTPIGNADSGGSSGHIQMNATTDNQTSTTFNTGNNTTSNIAINLQNPIVYYNVFMKL
jgi:microcystin-dependent protein